MGHHSPLLPITPPPEGDEGDGFSLRPPPSPEALAELLKLHGDRYRPILAALRELGESDLASTRDLLDRLLASGHELAERTLRLYLSEMAETGLIERHGRRGYRLAQAGAEVARQLTVARRLGSMLYRMEETLCQVDFDLAEGRGPVSVNAFIVPRSCLPVLCDELEAVFRAKLCVGSRVLFAPEGSEIMGRTVPAGSVGLGTLCSITLASMLMRQGVPSHPLFGGLLRVEGFKPQTFLEMIRYEGTTLSPNEVFIRAGLTSVGRAARTGAGVITASFREVPMSAAEKLREVARACEEAVFPGLMLVGRPGQPVLNLPVHEGRIGVVMATGLNPIAGLWERELRVDTRPMVGPVPYERLIPFSTFRHHALNLS